MNYSTKTIFVTGATGYLGSYFLYHLLQHTNYMVYCLGRKKGKLTAEERVYQKLNQIHFSFVRAGISDFDLADKITTNLKILPGDIVEQGLGLDEDLSGKVISEFWHIAANVQFLESKRHEIMQANVKGGRNVLEFVKQHDIPVLNYISTAYVAGTKTGDISECTADERYPVNNAYEQSKRIIEKEIIESMGNQKFNYRIFRPGIIVGHSVTLEPDISNGGLYGFMYLCAHLKDQLNNHLPGYLNNNHLKLKADRNSTLSLLPVDEVVTTMLEISKNSNTLNRIYHVTPRLNIPLKDVALVVRKILGLNIKLVSTNENFTAADRLFNRKVAMYSSYLFNEKQFMRSYDLVNFKDFHYTLDNKKLYALVEIFYNNLKKIKQRAAVVVS